MRFLSLILTAVIIGGLVGGAVAYVELRADLGPPNEFPGDKELAPIPQDGQNEKLAHAVADEPHYDFGKMQRGTTMSHNFTIRNTGAAPLKIAAGGTSCKCTISEVGDKSIPPGGSTEVKIQWTAKSDNGPFRQTAKVTTDDPMHSLLEFTIDGIIVSASGVEPGEFMFDKIPVGESRTAQVLVMAMLQDDLQVTDPQITDVASRERFDVKIEPVDPKDLPNKEAKRGIRISLTAKDNLPVGRLSNLWLHVKTNLDQADALEIPIMGQVVGDISVRGNHWIEEQGALRMSDVKSKDGAKDKLSIMVRGAEATKTSFTLASCDPPDLKVTIGEPKKLSDELVQVPLEVEIPPGTRPMVHLGTAQSEAGKIVLSTTHPKIKELSIGVQFAVER